MPELWRPVHGFYGFYEVSDLGSVRSVARYSDVKYSDGRVVQRIKYGRVLSPKQQGDYGHLAVNLHVGGVGKMAFVHRLVLEAFVGPCPDGMVSCHNDGNSANNRPGNLRWDTPKSNTADIIMHGRMNRGEDRPNSRLTADAVREIRSSGQSSTVLARKFGVSTSAVSLVRRWRTWKGVV